MAFTWTVDGNGNIYKDGKWVPASSYAYVPEAVKSEARSVKQGTKKEAAGPKQDIAYTGTETKGSAAVKGTVVSKTASAAAAPVQSDRDKRAAEKAAYTGWDNEPSVRALQEKSWSIYVDTGKWDTAEQKELHAQSEKMRRYNNPMYTGSPYGPLDWMDAEAYFPRDTTPGANSVEGMIDKVANPDNWGSILKAGIGVVFLFFVVSMFRR